MENLYDLDYILELTAHKLGVLKQNIEWKPFQKIGVSQGGQPPFKIISDEREIYFVNCFAQTEWNPQDEIIGGEFLFNEKIEDLTLPIYAGTEAPTTATYKLKETTIPYGLYKKIIIAGRMPSSYVHFMIQGIRILY